MRWSFGSVAAQHLTQAFSSGHHGGGVEPPRLPGQAFDGTGDADGRDDFPGRGEHRGRDLGHPGFAFGNRLRPSAAAYLLQ